MAWCSKRPRAETDLVEIWQFIARDDPRAADRQFDRIEAQCQLLASNPVLGESGPKSHTMPAHGGARYLILYRALDDGVEIVRVVHGARAMEHIEF